MSLKGRGFRVADMPGVIPVLSFSQPWPEAIFGGKDVENRDWSTKHRGPLWMHAAIGIKSKDYAHAVEFIGSVAPHIQLPSMDKLVRGAIVGLTWVTGITDNRDLELTGKQPENKWAFYGQFGWTLDPARTWRLGTPLGMLGAQSLWRLTEDETKLARDRLPSVALMAINQWKDSQRGQA